MTTVVPCERRERWTTGYRVAAAFLLFVHAYLAWSLRVPGLSGAADDSMYLLLARALRSWSYAELWTVGNPTHAMYPPGYPGLLALVGATGPAHVGLAVSLNIALSVAALGLTAVLAGRVAPWLAVAVLVVCVPNPTLVHLAGAVMSEPLFTTLSLGAVLLLATDAPTARTRAVAGALAIAAALTRSIGVVLVIAMLAEWSLQRRWRPVVVLAACACLTVGAWTGWTVLAPHRAAGASYVADALLAPAAATPPPSGATAGDGVTRAQRPRDVDDSRAQEMQPWLKMAVTLATRVPQRAIGYVTSHLPGALAQPNVTATRIDEALSLVVLLLAGGIGFVRLHRWHRLTAVYVAAYAGLLLIWPYGATRFLAPVLPIVVLMLLAGIWTAGSRWLAPRRASVAVWVFAGAIGVLEARQVAIRWVEVSRCDRSTDSWRDPSCASAVQREFRAAIDTAARLAKVGSPLLTSKDAIVYMFSGRVAVPQDVALEQRDPKALVAYLREQRVDVVILSRTHIAQWGLSPMLITRCQDFELLASFGPQTKVLRLRRADDVSLAPEPACEAIRSWALADRWGDLSLGTF
jgi:hypothetical protein